MANSPQLENGFTRVANEILEQIARTPLPGAEFRLVIAIWRATYGYQRKSAAISLTRFQQLTALSRTGVKKALGSLRKKRVVHRRGKRGLTACWQFNKDFSSWREVTRDGQQQLPSQARGGQPEYPRLGNESIPKLGNNGYPIKERKKTLKKKEPTDSRRAPVIEFFLAHYEKINGRALVTHNSDFKALKDLLTKTTNKPGYDTVALQQAAHNFLESKDEFHRKQGHPLRFWANNISAFMPKQSGQRETPEYLN